MRNSTYAAGSIVEAIESGQVLKNVGGGHVHIVTVKATNPYGMVIVTEHASEFMADWQRNQYRLRGYTEIE